MRHDDRLRNVLEGEVHSVPRTEAVPRRAECGHALLLESDDDLVEGRAGDRRAMVLKPGVPVKFLQRFMIRRQAECVVETHACSHRGERDGITVEIVRDDRLSS
jgi:hypothetical protein